MQQTDPVIALTILLASALVGGMIAHRLRQPVILGYLVIGVAVGPYALSLVPHLEMVQAAATIGVTLLMFALGLELSPRQLMQQGKVGLGSGAAQILGTALLGTLASIVLFRWSLAQSLLFGLIIYNSSTAICLKLLMERGELDSVHGRITIAVSIVQDIAAILLILVLPLLGRPEGSLLREVGQALGKTVAFVVIAIVLGVWVLPWLLGRVGGIRTRELFLLTVLTMGLGAALSTYIFGLSMVFGAFLVGFVLREFKFTHQAIAEITPLRDVFAALFFVSLGMLLDPRIIWENWGIVTAMVPLILLIKLLVVMVIVRAFGLSLRIGLLTGSALAQVGEFGFILAQAGLAAGLISEKFYSLILGSAIITMLLAPLLMGFVSLFYRKPAPATTAGEGV